MSSVPDGVIGVVCPLSGDAFTVDKPQSSRAPSDNSPKTADIGIAHAAASDALITYAAPLTDRHDDVVRRLEGRNWHGLNGGSQAQDESKDDDFEHVRLLLPMECLIWPYRSNRDYPQLPLNHAGSNAEQLAAA
jgi:hypothetical protein